MATKQRDDVLAAHDADQQDIQARQEIIAYLSGGALYEFTPLQAVAALNAGPLLKTILLHILEGGPADDETILGLVPDIQAPHELAAEDAFENALWEMWVAWHGGADTVH